MSVLLYLAAIALAICLVLTPLCRDLFFRAGVVDRPDQLRKMHVAPMPQVGGIPIAIAYLGSLVCFPDHLSQFMSLLPAAGLIFATGLLDDLIGLSPWQKLLGETAAALSAYWGGVQIAGVNGWWSLPLTIAWLLICTNAFNLIDGIDGLASGLGLLAATATLCVGLLRGDLVLAVAAAPLAGALLGFLRYNFSPASIFLGDSGSLLVGFLLGCFGVAWSRKTGTLFAMTAPLMAFALPILDVGLSVLRRFFRGKSILEADRGHIHHRLLDRGFSQRKAALVLYAGGALAALFSIAQSLTPRWLLAAVFVICVWVFVAKLQYPEIREAVRRLAGTPILEDKLENSLVGPPNAQNSLRR